MSEDANKPTPEPSPEPSPRPSHRLPMRVVLRAAVPMVVVVIVAFIVFGSPDSRTVSQVIDEIRGIALAKPQGGLIGPWWVSATGIDEESGRLTGFKVECGPIDIAAGMARVIVNHHSNTFQFEMWDVVFARLTDPENPGVEHTLQHMDRYVLGPLPYPENIVADAGGTGLPLVGEIGTGTN